MQLAFLSRPSAWPSPHLDRAGVCRGPNQRRATFAVAPPAAQTAPNAFRKSRLQPRQSRRPRRASAWTRVTPAKEKPDRRGEVEVNINALMHSTTCQDPADGRAAALSTERTAVRSGSWSSAAGALAADRLLRPGGGGCPSCATSIPCSLHSVSIAGGGRVGSELGLDAAVPPLLPSSLHPHVLGSSAGARRLGV